MRAKTETCLLAAVLFASLLMVGEAEITAPLDVTVLRDGMGVDNASVRIDGQYRGVTAMGGHIYVPDLTVGFHAINVQYEDESGRYVGNSGFEIKSGDNTARVHLQRSR